MSRFTPRGYYARIVCRYGPTEARDAIEQARQTAKTASFGTPTARKRGASYVPAVRTSTGTKVLDGLRFATHAEAKASAERRIELSRQKYARRLAA